MTEKFSGWRRSIGIFGAGALVGGIAVWQLSDDDIERSQITCGQSVSFELSADHPYKAMELQTRVPSQNKRAGQAAVLFANFQYQPGQGQENKDLTTVVANMSDPYPATQLPENFDVANFTAPVRQRVERDETGAINATHIIRRGGTTQPTALSFTAQADRGDQSIDIVATYNCYGEN